MSIGYWKIQCLPLDRRVQTKRYETGYVKMNVGQKIQRTKDPGLVFTEWTKHPTKI